MTLSMLGFKIISAGRNEYNESNNITYIGFNTQTRYSSDKELIPVDTVLDECNNSLNIRNLCVIMIHPQDYVDNENKLLYC